MSETKNPYRQVAADFASLVLRGRALPRGGLEPPVHPEIPSGALTALFFAPHPDDETILGGLALRLLRESRWNVINVALTQGSKPARRAQRWEELQGACEFLGFGLRATAPGGLEGVTAKTRAEDPAQWALNVHTVSQILSEYRPRVIFFPHERDWNATHVGAHFLVMDALQQTPDLNCHLVETEFWGQMATPNLLVEYDTETVGDLIAATSFHIGEIQRNPYHITIPAWMLDNVRRGAELVGGQGGAAPPFLFGQLFRLQYWRHGRLERCHEGGRYLAASARADSLFSA